MHIYPTVQANPYMPGQVVVEIKDMFCAHIGCMGRKKKRQYVRGLIQYIYKYVKNFGKKYAPTGCTGSQIFAPGHQNVHTGCRVHP